MDLIVQDTLKLVVISCSLPTILSPRNYIYIKLNHFKLCDEFVMKNITAD